jgi:hypothetical protein
MLLSKETFASFPLYYLQNKKSLHHKNNKITRNNVKNKLKTTFVVLVTE